MGVDYTVHCGPAIVVLNSEESDPSWYDVSEAVNERLMEERLEIRQGYEPRYFVPNIGNHGIRFDPRSDTNVSIIDQDRIEQDILKFETDFDADIQKVRDMFPGEGRVAVKWVILTDAR